MHWLERIFAFTFHVALFVSLVAAVLDDLRQREMMRIPDTAAQDCRLELVKSVRAGVAISNASRVHHRITPKVQPLVTSSEIENAL